MNTGYKFFISVFAIACSILASGIGFGLVGDSRLVFPQRLLCNFIFIMQSIATIWCVIIIFRKTKER